MGGLLRWDGHTAQTLLHKDLTDNNDVTEQEKYELCIAGKAELTTQMRQDLFHSRVEYMEFPFHRFSSFVSAKIKTLHGGKVKRQRAKCYK
ncbi:hypothetical protein ACA910_006550 [Epithemia clementina (nom. ined.)]